eukprot:CAMPEP_0194451100 /NCGR_PEP_ID=MMETSP0176-20130528/131116_1 /TAXON_ID=216777 /ORGANISM="Proboscia alata, Strain PI-D3" /LENGTH=111 /DNA_ID=CAMNT_0039278509 /DNA_START=188 /DNA_END=519 /DNA_ORIENTATION=-
MQVQQNAYWMGLFGKNLALNILSPFVSPNNSGSVSKAIVLVEEETNTNVNEAYRSMILIALSLQKSLFVNRFPKKLKFEECVSHTDSSTTTNGSTDDDAPATRPFLSCLLW